jgi:hypothetical protein
MPAPSALRLSHSARIGTTLERLGSLLVARRMSTTAVLLIRRTSSGVLWLRDTQYIEIEKVAYSSFSESLALPRPAAPCQALPRIAMPWVNLNLWSVNLSTERLILALPRLAMPRTAMHCLAMHRRALTKTLL